MSDISSVSVSDCETDAPSPSPTKQYHNGWSDDSDSSDSVSGGSGRRLMDSSDDGVSSGGSDSDSGGDSDSDSDSDEDGPGKCVDGEDIIYRDGLCDDDSSQGDDPTTDGFLADICVTYNITEINPDSNCDEINSLFLELCSSNDTDFDPDALGIGDIDNIISDDTLSGNNVESASGSRNDDGDLGITVVLEDPNVDSFTLCFDKVIVTTSFNQTKDDLDVAEGTINITNYLNEPEECNGVGLPCLSLVFYLIPCGLLFAYHNELSSVFIGTDFFFGCDGDLIGPEDTFASAKMQSVENCDCENGMTQITLRYVGEQTASKILGFYNVMNTAETPLKDCEFVNVQNGDTITCSAGAYGTFKRKTRFEIYYDGDNEDEADCIGDARTKCRKMIVGRSLPNCDDLVVLSHLDGDGAFCDANILSADIAALESNAIVDNERSTSDPLRVWKELDLWIRWMLICLLIAFLALIGISYFLCCLRRRKESKQIEKEETLDDVMKHIALKKLSEKRHSEEVEGSLVRHISMTLAKRRRTTWGANAHTNVRTHRAVPTTSAEIEEDDDLAFENEYYVEEEDASIIMRSADGGNSEYVE